MTVRQDFFEQADVPHGPRARRAGVGRVPFGPVHGLHDLRTSFLNMDAQTEKAAADVTPAEAFLDFTPTWHLRQPGSLCLPSICLEGEIPYSAHPNVFFHMQAGM